MATANEYPTERIRNIAVLGHGGSGKTSLVDALCFVAGCSDRHGDVAEGTALTMCTEEENGHGLSMKTTPAFAEWRDTKLNLLDTPGYMDFTGEARAAARVADGAVVVLGAAAGVEVGTETVWRYREEHGLPTLLFVSMMDKPRADFDKVYEEIRRHLTDKVIPVEIPIGAGEDFRGIINLFSGRAHLYEPGTESGEYEETDVPPGLEERFAEWRTELLETIATTDDALLEQYLEGDGIGREQALEAMKAAMLDGELYPLFCGAPERTWGTRALLSKMVELLPNPAEAEPELASRPGVDQVVGLEAGDDGPFAALVFKTTREPHVGELSHVRVVSGSATAGAEVHNANTEAAEALAHLTLARGAERLDVARLHAGDIGVVARLTDTHTNDTLCSADRPLALDPIRFPEPDTAVAIRAEGRADEDKLSAGLRDLAEEDPTFHSEYDAELGQTLIRGLGELHLDVNIERLERAYDVRVTKEAPRIPYRETIRARAEGRGKHKKQSGGHGQYGDCHIRLRPRGRGEGYEFVNSIKGGAIPTKYVPAVDEGIQEAAGRGLLAGYPVVDFEAECYDGSHHSVDSSDGAFRIAGSKAFRLVAPDADPVLLEPIYQVEITTPERFMGDIMGDLSQRRGQILGTESDGRKLHVRARVPLAELYKYATRLRSLTHGRAHHTREPHGYEEVPSHIADTLIAEAEKAARA